MGAISKPEEWSAERYALYLRAAKAIGIRVYEPNTLPDRTEEDLLATVLKQRRSIEEREE